MGYISEPMQGATKRLVRSWKCCGYKCMVLQSISLCGYVRLPKKHPDSGKTYYDLDGIDAVCDACDTCETYCESHNCIDGIEVHGGLTFSSVDDLGYTWFGFDCAHPSDNWTEEEVVAETESMAKQFKKRAKE